MKSHTICHHFLSLLCPRIPHLTCATTKLCFCVWITDVPVVDVHRDRVFSMVSCKASTSHSFILFYWPNNNSWWGHAIFCLRIHLWMEIWFSSIVGQLKWYFCTKQCLKPSVMVNFVSTQATVYIYLQTWLRTLLWNHFYMWLPFQSADVNEVNQIACHNDEGPPPISRVT